MHNFEFYWPVKFVFGPGELKKTGLEAKKIGKKALLVTGRSSTKKTGVLDRVTGYLKNEGVDFILFDEIESNPRSTTIDKAGKIAKKEKCDFILGLGGGSAMDASKCISFMAKSEEGVSIWEYMFCHKNPKQINVVPLPVMLIPTLPATGSEGNQTAVVTNWELHQKVHIMHPALFPKVSIVDPELTLTLTNEQLAYAGVDIICHLLEPYLTTTGEAFIKDRMAEGVIVTVLENLPKAISNPKDIESRSNLSWAGTMACSPFRFFGWNGKGFLHWMEHCLSAWTDVPHSEGLSRLLISWMTYMLRFESFKFRLEIFGKRVFRVDSGKETIKEIAKWLDEMQVETALEEVNDEIINKMSDTLITVYSGGTGYVELLSGEKLTNADFKQIYENAK